MTTPPRGDEDCGCGMGDECQWDDGERTYPLIDWRAVNARQASGWVGPVRDEDGNQLNLRGVHDMEQRVASEAALARMRRLGLLCAVCDRDRTHHHEFVPPAVPTEEPRP